MNIGDMVIHKTKSDLGTGKIVAIGAAPITGSLFDGNPQSWVVAFPKRNNAKFEIPCSQLLIVSKPKSEAERLARREAGHALRASLDEERRQVLASYEYGRKREIARSKVETARIRERETAQFREEEKRKEHEREYQRKLAEKKSASVEPETSEVTSDWLSAQRQREILRNSQPKGESRHNSRVSMPVGVTAKTSSFAEESTTRKAEILYFNEYKNARDVARKMAAEAAKAIEIKRKPTGKGHLVIVPVGVKREFLNSLGALTAEKLFEHRVNIGTFAAVVMMLLEGKNGIGSISEDSLVLDAFRRSDDDLIFASTEEIAAYLANYTPEQQQGIINNVKGIYHEMAFVKHENADGDEWFAEMMPTTHHPGVDVILTNQDTGEIVELQLKATDSVSYVKTAIDGVPEDVQVLSTDEVAARVAGVDSTGFSNAEITEEVESATEALSEATGEAIVGEILDDVLTGGAVAGVINAGRKLHNGEEIDGSSLLADVATVVARGLLISFGLSFF